MSLTALVFVVAFLTGSLLAFARYPIYGLMTYAAVFYLSPPTRWWGQSTLGVRWQLIAAAVTLLALLLSRRKVRARPLLGQKVIVCLLLFLLWLGIQSIWVLDWEMHRDLLVMYARFIIIVALIYACMDSHKHLQLFLWTHVLGCFYLGWIVYSTYEGGRFEAFGGE